MNPSGTASIDGTPDVRQLIGRRDWAQSALGEPAQWPAALQTTLALMLDAQFPMFLAWGEELVFLYNDAYSRVLGGKHPAALGRRMDQVWHDIWSDIAPLVERALAGESTFSENLPLLMRRRWDDEQTWFTFSYSPLRDDNGKTAGLFCVCQETTQQMHAARRQSFQLEVADRLRGISDADEIIAKATALLGRQLGSAYVGYGETDAQAVHMRVRHEWARSGTPRMNGQTRAIEELGTAVAACLREGRALSVTDVARDERSAPQLAVYESMDVRSLLVVPLLRHGRFAAVLYVHENRPRRWSAEDISLTEDLAERIWSTLERVRAEQALSRQLAAEGDRLRRLFEQAPGFMAVLRGHDHVFELANAAFLRLVGERELVGRNVRQALPELEGQGFFELLDRVFGSGEPYFANEAPIVLRRRPDAPAQARYVDFIYQPVLGEDGEVAGIFVEGYDRTDRRLVAQALRDSEARYRTLIDSVSAVVWRTDAHGGMIGGNHSWRAFTGQSETEYMGTGWSSAIHPEDRAHVAAAWQAAVRDNAPYEITTRLRRADGEYRHVLVRAAAVRDSDGRVHEWIGNCVDVTDARQAEEALRTADRRKDEFLAMLAHELRNPLAPIRTAAQVLEILEIGEPRVRHASGIISRQVEHMTRLVDDLLDVSRATRGLISLDKDVLDIRGIAASAVEQVRPLIEGRSHRLVVDLPPQALNVCGDRTRLIQIIANLLNNAAKYTPDGGLITLAVGASGEQVRIEVRDNGIGMPADLLPTVFELFVQAERSPDRSQGGLGLGLALVRRLVELHHGQVKAASAGQGQGSTFTILLPRMHAADDAEQAPSRDTPAQAQPLSLLVVDDNVDAAESLATLLQLQGHQVAVEPTAQQALTHAREHRPEVYLLDIGLPEIDGHELARRLRKMPEAAGAVLIALTGYGQSQDIERSMAAGFDYHLVKPADPSHLSALLAGLAGREPAQAGVA